jgi:hypothetical protein
MPFASVDAWAAIVLATGALPRIMAATLSVLKPLVVSALMRMPWLLVALRNLARPVIPPVDGADAAEGAPGRGHPLATQRRARRTPGSMTCFMTTPDIYPQAR